MQTLNRQFRLVMIAAPDGPRRLVVEEAYDVRYCLGGGGASSEATITAWLPDSNVTTPLFRITGRGVSGEPVGNLYRLQAAGCCGSGRLDTYFSLITGRALFSTSVGPLRVDRAGCQRTRYLGFHGTVSPGTPREASDSSVIGVLQMGGDQEQAQRVVLVADVPEPYRLERLSFVRDGRTVADTTLTILGESEPKSLAVAAALTAANSGRRVVVTIPIEADSLVPAAATLPDGIRVRP